MKVGLTGGIACGKSTVAELLRRRGAELIDSDTLAHAAMAPGQPAYAEVVGQFGPGILDADGTICRARLGEIVFRDGRQRERLNAIVHPRVRQQWQQQIRAWEASRSADSVPGVIVVVIPLLYEAGVESDFDVVVAVGCREQTQLERLRARGLTPEQSRERLQAQWPTSRKLDRADFVLWNDYSLSILEAQTRMLWNHLSQRR